MLVTVLSLATAVSGVRAGNEPISTLVTQWNREGLFDSTTTRGELLEMGRSAVGLQHYPLAEIYFQEMLLRNPADVDAMCELSSLYRRTNRLEYSRGLLLRAGALSPMRVGIADSLEVVNRALFASLSHTVDSLMTAQRYDEALPRTTALLAINPASTEALVAKSRCLAATGETDSALTYMDRAIAHDPDEHLHALRGEIATRIQKAQVGDMVASAKRLLDSEEWVRGETMDVLQAILAQDPSNEWARDEFRRLSAPPAEPDPTADTPASSALSRATHRGLAAVGRFLDRYLLAILAFFAAWALFRSPVSQALARRLHVPSTLAGDLSQIEIAAVLRTANDTGMTGVLKVKSAQGKARVFLQYGEPVHCEAFGKSGREALVELLREVEVGTFELVPRQNNVERTIDDPFQEILTQADPTTASALGVAAARKPRKSKMAELLETNSPK